IRPSAPLIASLDTQERTLTDARHPSGLDPCGRDALAPVAFAAGPFLVQARDEGARMERVAEGGLRHYPRRRHGRMAARYREVYPSVAVISERETRAFIEINGKTLEEVTQLLMPQTCAALSRSGTTRSSMKTGN
ncbi:MAG: hypothetical protein ACREIV_13845, partial [Planctomycetaceae bacterium]